MTEPKFKQGMKVWSVRHGTIELEYADLHKTYPIYTLHQSYTADGKCHPDDKFPSLYTLDEARKMGFSVPKEKMRVELTVEWKLSNGSTGRIYPQSDTSGTDFYFGQLEGKRGKMTFEEE